MDYTSYLRAEGKSENTIKSYLNTLQQLEDYANKINSSPVQLDSIQLQDYKKSMLEKYTPSSINNKVNGIKSFYKYLLEINAISKDPTIKLKEVKLPLIEVEKWLTEEKLNHLLLLVNQNYEKTKVKKVRNKLIIYLMLNAGLRISEVSNLLINEVDIKQKVLKINNSKWGQYRYVPINKDLLTVIKEWLQIIPTIHNNYFITSQKGGRLTESAIEYLFSTFKKYDLHIKPHDLRHTFAKRLADKNVSLQQIATLLGHKNINTTRIYTTNSMSELLVSVELLNREH